MSLLLFLIHRVPMEMSKAGSGEVGGHIAALQPQILSTCCTLFKGAVTRYLLHNCKPDVWLPYLLRRVEAH